jgi:hypothetical protein
MTEEKILYICNGDAPGCKKMTCHLKGGDCWHTSDISNARSFEFDQMTETYIEKESGSSTVKGFS